MTAPILKKKSMRNISFSWNKVMWQTFGGKITVSCFDGNHSVCMVITGLRLALSVVCNPFCILKFQTRREQTHLYHVFICTEKKEKRSLHCDGYLNGIKVLNKIYLENIKFRRCVNCCFLPHSAKYKGSNRFLFHTIERWLCPPTKTPIKLALL